MDARLPTIDLVLIGAGHTNMHIVRMWRMDPIPDVRLTLVSPWSRATYSGMLPGTLAGLYQPDDMEIDLWRTAASANLRLIVAEATGLDAERRRVLFADRPPLRFDVASIGIGSVPAAGRVWRRHPEVLSIKPMATFLTRLEAQLTGLRGNSGLPAGHVREPRAAAVATRDSDHPPHTAASASTALLEPPPAEHRRDGGDPLQIAIIGGGAAGTEITFCLERFLSRRGIAAHLRLIESGPELLPGYASQTRNLAQAEFSRRGVELLTGRSAHDFGDDRLAMDDGSSIPADLVIWAAGAAPPPVLEHYALPKADDGFLAVRRTLQSTGHDRVFVVGDTATFDRPLPKAGVYAVREGPVLWKNIRRTLRNEPLEEYDPQSGFLSLLSTGDGRAIAQYKGLAFHNRLMWKWKDHIDRKFMRMHQDYRPMSDDDQPRRTRWRNGSATRTAAPAMRCKGCGGKVGANVLSAALERLEIPSSPFALQGLDRPDDAAVLNPAAGAAEVLSVDFFQAFLDDPYLVGRVAALNALSDLWAMGAEPVGAMAMVTLPEGEPRQQAELLYQLLAGGLRELVAAGATLLGGHTTEAADLTLGYTVLGRLGGRAPTTKASLQPGDRLLLTKPLGTGTLLAAHMQSRCRAAWMDALLASMLASNAAAAGFARDCGATAVTDVTGFGLAGHLFEMLDASGVSARLSLDALPLLPGFAELAGDGVESTLAPANREVEMRIDASDAIRLDPRYAALFDPQTSGGLLVGLEAEHLDAVGRYSESVPWAIIGEVSERTGEPRLVCA